MISSLDSVMLYEIMNLRFSELREFKEEVLEKCARLLGVRRAYIKASVNGKVIHFLLGFKNSKEAEKALEENKNRVNAYVHEFDRGLVYLEMPEGLNCDQRRILSAFSSRIEEIIDKITSENKKLELEKLRVLVNSIPDAVVVVDRSCKVVEVNDSFSKLSGLSLTEVLNRKLYELPCFEEEDREKLKNSLKFCKKKSKVKVSVEGKYFEINCAEISGTDKIVLVFRDVTELEVTNRRLQTLVDCLKSFIFMKDKNLRYLLVNDAFARFVGLPKEKLIGRRDEEFLPPKLARICRKTDEEVLKTGRSKSFEVTLEFDGEVRYFEGYKVPVFRGNEVACIVGVIKDVTERKAVEELKRFRFLLDYSSDAIFITDERGNIVDLNEEARKWAGKSRNVREVIAGDWSSESFEGVVKDRIVSVSVRSATFGRRKYRIVIARDITNLKKTQQKIEELNEQLKLMNSLLRHDITNSITAILGFIEVYKDTGEVKYLERVEKIIDECIELINNVREFERALYEEKKLIPVRIDEVLLKAVEEVRREDVSVEINLESCEVVADEFLHSVLKNILVNAVQHNPKERKLVKIEVECGDDVVEVRIADNGPGIPDELKEKIFEKGFKSETTGKTGIGLYLVKSLMKKYGGSVEVRDNKSEGTVFVLKFRRYRSDISE